jgi:hypothetical protein
MGMNHWSRSMRAQRRDGLRNTSLATPSTRILVALGLLVAIWLPSAAVTQGTSPAMIATNAALTAALPIALAARRRKRSSRRSARRRSPRA